ncbi:MAG: pectate lyase [Halobacteriaceae archaeon]
MPPGPAAFVDPVRRFADRVLEDARDRFGDVETGLLADALDPETGDPIPHDTRDVEDGRLLANVASQQELLRTLVGLTELTGEERYREAAEDLVAAAFEHLGDGEGLLYWGGHAAYDLEADERTGQPGKTYHELKADYPYYDLLLDVDAERTRTFVESFWDAHVLEWSKLDFNRHGEFGEPRADPWANEFDADADVFFWGNGLTFVNTGSDLYYAAGVLADRTDDPAPAEWAETLAGRYVATRQETGIAGYQFSQKPSWCNGPEILGDRAQYQFAPYLHGDHLVYEGTLFRPRPYAWERALVLGDRLGGRGRGADDETGDEGGDDPIAAVGEQFEQWALEELRAWREAAYRPSENTFEPMLTDGHSLEGFVVRREGYFGPKGRVVGPIKADPSILMLYATGYRVTGAPVCWRMVRDVLAGLGLGDVGDPDEEPELSIPDDRTDLDLLYGLLECHRATEQQGFLDAATTVGRNVLDARYRDGLFVRGDVALVGDAAPLALLTLGAALDDSSDVEAVPTRGERPGVPPGGI